MTFSRIVRWCITLALAYFVLKFMGMTPADLWRGLTGRIDSFKQDTQQLTSGKTVQQISQKMKSEMQEAQQVTANSNEMTRELQAERARIMEAKFDALQNAKIIPTEQGKLSEQVVKNAQMAGGQ